MSDRLFRLLPWAPCATLGVALLDVPVQGGSALSLGDVLLRPGLRELVVLWLVPSLVAFFHLGVDKSLPAGEKREWRRSLLGGGCVVALVYFCSLDRRMPPDPTRGA